MAALVDTNVLVYRFDPRFPTKQRAATELLREGIADGHPSAFRTRPSSSSSRSSPGRSDRRHAAPVRERCAARSGRAAEPVRGALPTEALVRTALRGAAAYQLSWFDAHLWAYAEHYGLGELLSEDFQHDRLYGSVRAVNPFV